MDGERTKAESHSPGAVFVKATQSDDHNKIEMDNEDNENVIKTEAATEDTTSELLNATNKAESTTAAAADAAAAESPVNRTSKAAEQQRADALAKQRARGTSRITAPSDTRAAAVVGAIPVSNIEPAAVVPGAVSVVKPSETRTGTGTGISQERQDVISKQRASRRATRMSERASTTIVGAQPITSSSSELPAPQEPSFLALPQREADDRVASGSARMGTSIIAPGAISGLEVPTPEGPTAESAPEIPPASGVTTSMRQESEDRQAKRRARRSTALASSVPGAQAVSSSITANETSPGPPGLSRKKEGTTAAQRQEAEDRLSKSRVRRSLAVTTDAVVGVQAVSPVAEPDDLAIQNAQVSAAERQEVEDRLSKSRARMASVATVIPGAEMVAPPALLAEPSAGPILSQSQHDGNAKAFARSESSISDSRMSTYDDASMASASTMGTEERDRRRQDRLEARSQRRDGESMSSSIGRSSMKSGSGTQSVVMAGASGQTPEARKLAREAASQRSAMSSASSVSSSQRSTGSTVFANMSEAERQRRYDAKMALMGQGQHSSFRDDTTLPASNSIMDSMRNSPALISSTILEDTQDNVNALDDGSDILASEDKVQFDDAGTKEFESLGKGSHSIEKRGSKDLESGKFTSAAVSDNELAVAIAIEDNDSSDGKSEKDMVYALEYDPDAKPPIYKNRRFRLYAIAGGILFIAVAIAIIVVVATSGEEGETVILTPEPTVAPTQSPTSAIESIYSRTIAEAIRSELVYEPGTPHYSATQWIINDDPKELAPDDPDLLQRFMMAFLWFHTTENGTSEWFSCNPPKPDEDSNCVFQDALALVPPSDGIRWLSGEDECTWAGVQCQSGPSILGFSLVAQNMTGTLPTELVSLPTLQRISVPFNEFTGSIPPIYGEIPHLADLELHFNMLTSTIPETFFERFIPLQNFNVGGNLLSGTIDTRLGDLKYLKGLHLFENNFSGQIPTEIGELDSLVFARLNENEFSGSLPTELGRLVQLNELWLNGNTLIASTIPTELGRLVRLNDLRLGGNALTGPIPEELFNLRSLSFLLLEENSLDGTLSTSLGQLSNLIAFRVNNNELTGPIPAELENAVPLRLAWLFYNQFTGDVPLSICNLVQPGGLEFFQTDCGGIPEPANECLCCSACCDREQQICVAAGA